MGVMRILVVRNLSNAETAAACATVEAYCHSQGIAVATVDSVDLDNEAKRAAQRALLTPAPDLILVLGGDGTLLRTVHFMHPLRVPLLGINFGHLGFLTNEEKPGVLEILTAALAGDVVAQKRTCLAVQFVCAGDDMDTDGAAAGDVAGAGETTQEEPRSAAYEAFAHDGGIDSSGLDGAREFFALNEVAITRGAMGRIIDFSFSVGGAPIATLRGDGLVVATATGSTAYALSAGGPLVAPSHGGLVVVPLAAHSLHSRAFVTGPSDVVEVTLNDRGTFRDATVFLDGEMLLFPSPVRSFVVTSKGDPVELLRYGSETFYSHAAEAFF